MTFTQAVKERGLVVREVSFRQRMIRCSLEQKHLLRLPRVHSQAKRNISMTDQSPVHCMENILATENGKNDLISLYEARKKCVQCCIPTLSDYYSRQPLILKSVHKRWFYIFPLVISASRLWRIIQNIKCNAKICCLQKSFRNMGLIFQ